MNYHLLYFASLADRTGCSAETIESQATELTSLYAEVAQHHGFTLGTDRLRVAVNGAIVGWNHVLKDGDEIVFLPPVSGG